MLRLDCFGDTDTWDATVLVMRRGSSLLLMAVSILVAGCDRENETSTRSGSATPPSSSPPAVSEEAAFHNALASAKVGEEREVRRGLYVLLHRELANAELPDGWHHAVSTEGGFEVDVPNPFNDFRMRGWADDGIPIRSFGIGSPSTSGVTWSVTCMGRKDLDVTKMKQGRETVGSPPHAELRRIIVGGLGCTLIVETKGNAPLPSEADRQRFFDSFKKTGDPVW